MDEERDCKFVQHSVSLAVLKQFIGHAAGALQSSNLQQNMLMALGHSAHHRSNGMKGGCATCSHSGALITVRETNIACA